MKSSILLLALAAAALTSCTTAYKTGQTPDDVYFSPTRPQDEYVVVEKNDDQRYQGVDEYYDDRYLRMRVSNRARWSELDDWYYYGNRYNYFYYPQTGLYYNPWTPNTYWNTYYNPYYGGHYGGIISPRSSVYTRPRTTNLNTYNNSMLTNSNYSNPKINSNSGKRTNNIFERANSAGRSNGNTIYTNNTRSSNGNGLRNTFGNNSGASNSSNNNSSSTSRPATTTSSPASSSSGSSGSTAPVRKF